METDPHKHWVISTTNQRHIVCGPDVVRQGAAMVAARWPIGVMWWPMMCAVMCDVVAASMWQGAA